MRRILVIVLFVFGWAAYSQSDALAKNYFEKGEFDKALPLYQQLHEKSPHRFDYFVFYIQCLQQLEQLDLAEKLLTEKISQKHFNKPLFIELGRNYLLQKNQTQATHYFQQAVESIRENPRTSYAMATYFEKYNLLDWAIQTLELGMSLDPSLDYSSSLARIYGEQGDFEKMMNAYLDLLEKNPNQLVTVQRQLSRYVNDDSENEPNQLLRRILLSRNQNNPQPYYNMLLSWLFVQQRQYDRAFVQERALYRLFGEGIEQIVDIAMVAFQDKDYEAAQEMFEFVSENAPSETYQLKAKQYLLNIQVETATPNLYPDIEKQYETLISAYENPTVLFDILLDYYHFLACNSNKKEMAIQQLKVLQQNNLTRLQEARVLMQLADILVFEEKFNEALIYYSQIQSKVKNDPLAQEARFKVARTSFFKGDFEWAQTQLDVLKKSTSQLIANDAMELSLLISDNSYTEESLQALQLYAAAELLHLQNKPQEAIAQLDQILQRYSGLSIEDETLLLQAKIFEKTSQHQKAIANYQTIIQQHSDAILVDNALFYLAELYHKTLKQPELAQPHYEQIIFNHPDSIYFVEARKQYRLIRGDSI